MTRPHRVTPTGHTADDGTTRLAYRIERRGGAGEVLAFVPLGINTVDEEEAQKNAYLIASMHELKAAAYAVCVSHYAGAESDQMKRAVTGLARVLTESGVPDET